MLSKIREQAKGKFKSKLFSNSAWGIFSNIFQNILFSVFFIVIARKYTTEDFGNYIIANTLYGFIVGFSALGLGYWFIREFIITDDKKKLVNKFFKIQLLAGVVFYFINVIMAFSLYDSQLVRSLSMLIGINIIFDNVIYVIKYINIAESEQKKSFIILTVEALLKFLVAALLLIYPIPILYLSLFLILLRVITLNLFIRLGSSNTINLREIFSTGLTWAETKSIIGANWAFVIIGSISVIYWRIGNIIVSKVLTLEDVANYEISYKLLSISYILPVIVSTSLYPLLISAFKESMKKMQTLYYKAFIGYSLYGLLAYTFIYSFADFIVPFLFGEKYTGTSLYCKEMFLTMLVFPSVFLQANVIITLKLEKLDMICNIASLVLNVGFIIIGFTYFQKSLSVVNYAIFFSFLGFHLIQDVVLLRKKVSGPRHVAAFYASSIAIVLAYIYLAEYINKEYLFFIFWGLLAVIAVAIFIAIKKKRDVAAVTESINFKDEKNI